MADSENDTLKASPPDSKTSTNKSNDLRANINKLAASPSDSSRLPNVNTSGSSADDKRPILQSSIRAQVNSHAQNSSSFSSKSGSNSLSNSEIKHQLSISNLTQLNSANTNNTSHTGNTGNTGNTGQTHGTRLTGLTGVTGMTGITGNTANTGNTGNTGHSNYTDLKSSITGNRASMMSDYSGVVQNVDIDTIKYIGNKESLQLSELQGLSSSSSRHSLNSDNYIDDNNHINISSTSIQIKKDDSDKNFEIPARSSKRRLSKDTTIRKVILTKTEGSPNKQNTPPIPPKSPLPDLKNKMVKSQNSSPLKAKHSRDSSLSSNASLKLHGRLDDIMKEVEDLKLEFQDESPLKKSAEKRRTSLTQSQSQSMTSISNSVYTSSSFHTARGDSIDTRSVSNGNEIYDGDEEDDQPTEILHIADVSQSSMLKPKYKSSLTENKKDEKKKDNKKIQQPPSVKTKTSSTYSHHTKNTSSSKSKRKTSSTKSKIRPFSYETLAKLLNATDGIIIGQEFATLNIPSEEKFLIERVVDSISRLTANMMLNPARYDQSCARLEHVLNVLEGFD